MATRIALARTKWPSGVPSARALAARVRCGQRLATTLGPAAASPLPLLPGLRPTQCVCEPLPQLLEGGSTHSSRVRNDDNVEIRFDWRLASVDGVFGRRRPSRTRDSLWGPLDPALLPGVNMIETPWCRETIVRHSACRSRWLRAAVV